MAEASNFAHFPTTHWSRVIAAGDRAAPEARAALAELCEAYWYPIYALIRCRGHRPEESSDLAQDYFTRLLEKGVIAAADQSKGRFRAFLAGVSRGSDQVSSFFLGGVRYLPRGGLAGFRPSFKLFPRGGQIPSWESPNYPGG